jgi:hypothetical protein
MNSQCATPALAFAIAYSVLISGNVANIKAAMSKPRGRAGDISVAVFFTLSTFAMFAVWIAPTVLTVLWCSALLDFVGYFILSSIVYGLGR